MKRAIVDLSSLVWTSLLGGKDKEFGRTVISEAGKEVYVNSASFGYEGSMEYLKEFMTDVGLQPIDMIFVMEGKNSKADRQAIHPAYKAGRDKVPEQYEQFNLCKEMILTAFLNCGSSVCWQDYGVEADDVIGYLADELDGEVWIHSGDKDMAVKVGGRIHHYRAGKVDENPFGDFPHKFITTYIALVGDSGDKIPGAKGFGEKAMQMMLMAFGNDGLELMEGLITSKSLKKLEEDVDSLKELQKIIDDQSGVYMSYELGRLRTEKVNTLRRPLEWRVGMVRSRAMCEDERLRQYHGVTRLVSQEHYSEAYQWVKSQVALSPFFTLDVETSTPPESDEWLEIQDKEDKVVDVFGSELTSLQMTFGPNLQYTIYMPLDNVEEVGVNNLTVAQIRDMVDLVPRHKITYVHNASFELPVCYNTWGADWASDPLYHGFLRNVRDTAIGSSYVNENRSRGLKGLSKDLLGYQQVSYDEVTTKEYLKSEWNGKGKLLGEWFVQIPVPTGTFGKVIKGTGQFEMIDAFDHYGDPVKVAGDEIMEEVDGEEIIDYVDGEAMVKVQHKMNQLTAKQAISYGADDTICTAALALHFRIVMEIEKTWTVYEEVETYPAYLTSLAFVQGKPFSLEDMAEMEREDDAAYAKAWPILRDYLIKIGFEGTRFDRIVELTPAEVKRAVFMVTGKPLVTQVRTISKLAKLIEDPLIGMLVSHQSIDELNDLMEAHFEGEPVLDLASPKQMKGLLYDHMKMPVRVINDVTPIERAKVPDLDNAVKKFKKIRAGTKDLTLTDADNALLRKKAKTDDTAIDMALAFDAELLGEEARAALRAIGTMKKVMTRRSLFYKNWRHARHWKDNKIHASANQCAAVTRRYSMSNPNEQQLPKKGQAVKFRGCYKPHKKNAVVASIDYVGQELRLAAERSQDKNMLACYVGASLKDPHSITAAGAMKTKWGIARVNELFETYGAELERTEEGLYQLFVRIHKTLGKDHPVTKEADDLRKDAKNINFGAQNGAMAAKLSETLIMRFEDAQLFLDARNDMFPGVGKAAAAAADECKKYGYVKTLMGGRRHLRDAILSDERGSADRAARQAWNFQIQSSAGEMTKLGMSRLWLSGIYFKYDARFMAPIHDELVSSVVAEHAVDFLREKNACMTQPYSTMTVPILGSISIGPDFAKQIECGDWFIEERIKKALIDIFAAKDTNVEAHTTT